MLSPYIVTVITKEDAPYNVIPNAPIEIRARLANGTSGGLSLIFEDSQGLFPITQTGATADTNGQFVFYAAAAEYNAIYQSQTVPVDMGLTPSTLPAFLISDLSQAYEFATVAAYKAFTTAFPVGKKITIRDRDGGVFYIVSGTGAANTFNIIASDQVSQSADLGLNDKTTSKQFGMVWDGVTDDADAYESASNTMAVLNLQLNHPAGRAILGRNVTITGGINQVGSGGWTPFNSGTVLDHGAFTIFLVGNEPQFTRVLFEGASELSGTNVSCETADPENDQNVDARFIDCVFFRAFYSVAVNGRGMNFINCGFSLFRRCLKIDWPNPFTPPGLPEQSLEFGMRGYVFFDCRWHASNGAIIENKGYNNLNIHGVSISGYSDAECGIIDGSLNDFNIDINILYGLLPVFTIADGFKITNGKLTGTLSGVKATGDFDKGFANILSMGATGEIDNVIIDVACRDVKGSAFALAGTVGNLTIKGTYKDICKQNDVSIGGATRYLIQDFGATYNGVVKFEGQIDLPNFANNPTYLVDGLTDEEFYQGLVNLPDYIQVFGGNIRGRAGGISRHTYTGDGSDPQIIALPAACQYVIINGAQPNANQQKSGIAILPSAGGTGDVILTDNKTLSVSDDFNALNDVFIYIVHY